MTTAVSSDPFAALNGVAATAQTKNQAEAADRFLKLLVTQMQNQDPLNPMDNAQITSQMAQINTVSGIEKLNTTVDGLNNQFVQMQALQGAALVGRTVTLQGDRVAISSGSGAGGFDLSAKADSVKVEIRNPAGRLIETVDLGSLQAGRHAFAWTGSNVATQAESAEFHFKVVAKTGTAAVSSTPLMRDTVRAISTQGDRLTLQTQYSGDVAYGDVRAFN